MDELIPYLGVVLVILTGMAAVTVLARHGVHIRRIKHDKTELEFGEIAEDLKIKPVGVNCGTKVSGAMIRFNSAAEADFGKLGMKREDVMQFILSESERHPLLFATHFSSLPLVFGSNVIIISWDRTQVIIERILSREQAYPLNDAWSSCLAVYRQATMLPYRNKKSAELYTSAEARQVLFVYRRLVAKIHGFLALLSKNDYAVPQIHLDIETLVEEAEFALANDDIATAVARLEIVLSTIHKVILNCAPQGPLSSHPVPPLEKMPRIVSDGRKSILIVDDDEIMAEAMRRALESRGYAVTACTTTIEAFRALVENEFDLVITDLVMPMNDGGEVARAAKTSGKKTKIVVFTGYYEMSRIADLASVGVDHVFQKSQEPSELFTRIDKILEIT